MSERITLIENTVGKKAASSFGGDTSEKAMRLDSFCSALQGEMTVDPISW